MVENRKHGSAQFYRFLLLMHEIDDGDVATGNVMRFDILTFGKWAAVAVNHENPPVAFQITAFGRRQAIHTLSLRGFVIRIIRIDPRNEIREQLVEMLAVRQTDSDSVLFQSIVVDSSFDPRVG